MTKSQKVEWNEIEILVEILCKKIFKTSRKFSSITTIGRGGFVPARLVADCLDIKKIYVDKKRLVLILYLLMTSLTLEKHLRKS